MLEAELNDCREPVLGRVHKFYFILAKEAATSSQKRRYKKNSLLWCISHKV